MFKLVCLIWLLVLSSFASLATSAGTAGIPICTVPFPQPAGTLRFDYDCGIQTHIGYDSQCVASIVLKSDPRIAACGFDGTKMQPTGETRFKIARLTAFSAIISKFLAAETTANTPLALGLTDAGLEQFAQARGATIATGENWQTTVLDALNDPNTTVHFNLDQVDVWQGVQRAASGQGGPTDWELLQIQQNPQSWDTLQFWKGGQPAPNPFK